jgi:tetratricopeptide (TPR) repeat protein
MLTRSPLLLLLALLLCGVPRALAAGQETNAYTEAVQVGLSEFEEKNFLEARAHFARAHAIYPNARTLRALGMVQFELKNYIESVHFLQEALSASERALDSDKRERTEKLLTRALGYIARLTLDIEPATQVLVDGKSTSLSSGAELVLAVGEHAIEFSAPGRMTDKRTLTIQGGEQETLRVKLAAVSSERAATSGKNEDTAPGRPVYKSPWLWTALGVVVVGAAVGTALVLTREKRTETTAPDLGTGGMQPLTGPSQSP